MKIISYEAHNVLGVKDIRFDMEGRHLFLVGGNNGAGKTSALTALVMTLCGKSGMGTKDYPAIALRDGQKKGKVTIELTGSPDLHEDVGLTAELSLRRKASGVVVEEFRLLDSTGAEAPEPRKTLQRLFQLKAFDPLEFERMKPKEKASCVQQMLGLDLSKYDKEHKEVFDERTAVNRDGKKLVALLEGATKHKDAPKEEVKVADVLEQIDVINTHQASRAKQMSEIKAAEKVVVEWEVSVGEAEKEIARLEEALRKGKEFLAHRQNGVKEFQQELAVQVKALDNLKDRAEELPPLREQIANAEETNRKVRENQAYDKLAKEVKDSREKWKGLDDRLKEIAEERAEEVSSADWPIEGMELQEDGLVWNGLPFEQASTSQRIMASVAVGMRLNPELRLLVCEHGSDLDVDTLEALDAVLKEKDFQMIVELVCRSKEDEERCAVVIADGEVVGATKAQDTEESSDTDEDEQE